MGTVTAPALWTKIWGLHIGVPPHEQRGQGPAWTDDLWPAAAVRTDVPVDERFKP